MLNEDYLDGLTPEDKELSQRSLALLQGKKLIRYRFDSQVKELYMEFDDGTRLFVNNVSDKQDISIT